MQPKNQHETPDLFRARLDQVINLCHPLVKLAQQINWLAFENQFKAKYTDGWGRPGSPIRLLVGLHYLKHAFNESDESVVARFLENPYWQYFCGFEYFQHEFPIDASSLTRFRQRIGVSGTETLFKELIVTAQRTGSIEPRHLNKINIDTTVQEKAIAFPTDARLYYKMRAALVRAAQQREIKLRQTYVRLAKATLARQSRYAQVQQYQRARKATKSLKTMLGRVQRDIQRQVTTPDEELKQLLELSQRLLDQKKNDHHKVYSIHAPEVECIAKGKAHKRYEFGVKVGLATTSRDNWIVGVNAYPNNPYDGHTLSSSIKQVETMTGWSIQDAYVDLGYRGHDYKGDTTINIVNHRVMKSKTRTIRYWWKRRAAIEPVIGHVKSDHRMSRNYLKGASGDQLNAVLCASGFNFRKLLAVFFLCRFIYRRLENNGLNFVSRKVRQWCQIPKLTFQN